MEERLVGRKKSGIGANALKTWGLVFLICGVIGRGVIQNGLLGIGKMTAMQLLDVMNASKDAMLLATVSLALQAVETCAVPIFAFMLTEGVRHTSSFKNYFLRIFLLALVTEIPYNLAIDGELFAMSSRNPVFSLVLCMVMLYLFRRYPGKSFKNIVLKVVFAGATIVWCEMLKVEFGSAMVLVTAVLWALHGTMYRNFVGAAASIVCTVFSLFFMASPMGFMAVHLYNGEKSDNNRYLTYLSYPCILLIAALAGYYL